MTVLGIDISKWNGNWNAGKAKSAGASFVFAKASQATYTDPQFVANWQKAKEAGLLRGAFHYLDYGKTGAEQAHYFADLLQDDPGELPPVVDYELRRTDNNAAKALAVLKEFLTALAPRLAQFESRAVRTPMIYFSPGFWKEYGTKADPDYWIGFPLWLAHYTTSSSPIVPAPWTMWNFWQFTAKGPGEAFGSESLSIDMNRFNGTLEELLEFVGQSVPASNADDLYADLVRRTTALEESLAAGAGGAPLLKSVETRLASLELKYETISGSLAAPLEALDQRLGRIEQQLAAPVVPAEPETPATPEPEPESESGPESAGVYATCTTKALNVRSGPGASHPMVAGLSSGQRVKVLERQNGWARIENPSGWCSEFYLAFEQEGTEVPQPEPDEAPEAAPQETGVEAFAVCNTNGLNVRSGPGVSYGIVGGLTYGQRVRVLKRQNGWAQVERPSGWSNENYLSFSAGV